MFGSNLHHNISVRIIQICVLSVSKSWPEFPAPYLTSVHASAVTCLAHITDIEPGMLETLTQV